MLSEELGDLLLIVYLEFLVIVPFFSRWLGNFLFIIINLFILFLSDLSLAKIPRRCWSTILLSLSLLGSLSSSQSYLRLIFRLLPCCLLPPALSSGGQVDVIIIHFFFSFLSWLVFVHRDLENGDVNHVGGDIDILGFNLLALSELGMGGGQSDDGLQSSNRDWA